MVWMKHRKAGNATMVAAALIGAFVAGTAPAAHASVIGGGFNAMAPVRVLDTRAGNGSTGPVGPGGVLHLQVTGRDGLPSSNLAAVELNVTATAPGSSGYITVWPEGQPRPGVSNLDFVAGQTVANMVVVRVGSLGRVDLYNGSAGSVQLVADASGWWSGGSIGAGGLTALNPVRVMDTRAKSGVSGPIGAGRTAVLAVDGRGGVPPTGVEAVAINVTVTAPTAGGYITAWPDGKPRPGTSNLDFSPNQTVPNLAIVPVGSDGKVDFFNGSSGAVQLVGDVFAWFKAGTPGAGGLHVTGPARILDTRHGVGEITAGAPTGPIPSGGGDCVYVTYDGHVPDTASAVVINLTATQPGAPGYVVAYPNGSGRPNASTVNFTPNETVPNLAIAQVGASSMVNVDNVSAGSTHVVIDVFGWFG